MREMGMASGPVPTSGSTKERKPVKRESTRAPGKRIGPGPTARAAAAFGASRTGRGTGGSGCGGIQSKVKGGDNSLHGHTEAIQEW